MRPGRFGRYAIRTADGVQEAAYLPIGGIEQYIRVRGRSRANPVLLVLHGGPGSTLGATACRWQGALEAAFTVVHWDQRGSGNTYYRDPAAPPPTVERLLSDLDELVDALRARYGRDRLFLLGHSWGSLLGGLYALRRPEKLSAWLPVSQMVDFKRSEQVSAAEAIRRARGAGREEDAERLAQELEQVLAQADRIREMAKDFAGRDDVFFIGRNLDYALSMEGSLKLKEISYIHSEAYASGELKHGTISLIEEGTPVIALSTYGPLFDKAMSNVVEVQARGANVLALTTETHRDAMAARTPRVLTVPDVEPMLLPQLGVAPLQLLAYYIALERGCDIDKPRNLAKSVTVE